MSGVYIKGIEIPTDNTVLIRVFPASENGEYYVQQLDVDGDILDELWAVPVPPHGDLIDRNTFAAEMKKRQEEAGKWLREAKDHDTAVRADAVISFLCEIKLTLDKMPTIIPAEEGE